ncbi:MAG: glycosyltransferase [Candidatus Scalindua sp.]|jgi:glycosyltransferase involved in cell wall biosynthesis|nr:glycosyltransferase [Candidatus Scalindua sp.]
MIEPKTEKHITGDNIPVTTVKPFEVVIPVYNEEKQLEKSILTLYEFLDQEYPSVQWNITIANNGSIDSTKEIAVRLAEKYERIKYFHLNEKGFGKAIKSVWNESTKVILGFMDLDLSTDLKHVPEAINILQDDSTDLVVGNRLGSKSLVENRKLLRKITSRVFNFILKKYLRVTFSDGMCGFKFIKKKSFVKLIDFGIHNDGWFFSTELLILAEWLNFNIYEIPVHWVDTKDSKVKIIELAKKFLKEMVKVKSRLRYKKYQRF